MKETEWVTLGNERANRRETTSESCQVQATYSNIEVNWRLKDYSSESRYRLCQILVNKKLFLVIFMNRLNPFHSTNKVFRSEILFLLVWVNPEFERVKEGKAARRLSLV